MAVRPITLKDLVADCGISQRHLGDTLGLSRTSINLVLNRGYMPPSHPALKNSIESIVRTSPAAIRWLTDRGLTVEDVWAQAETGTDPVARKQRRPAGFGRQTALTHLTPAMRAADPAAIAKTKEKEVEMLTEEAKRHFKMFRNPFINDVLEDKDIYMSEEHRYIEAAMIDAAKHAGFIAVIGEVQSGKSIMRRKVVLALQREGNVRVIFPQIIDKDRVTASSLCDAIIHDISSEPPRQHLEDKSRQVYRLLLERHRQGLRHVIIIEEAHDLSMKVIKLLKRFYELEDGYTKLLGIILIAQTELAQKLNENDYPWLREAIRRIQVVQIRGLNGNVYDYLALKFKRIGVKVDDVFDRAAIEVLSKRLTDRDGRTNKVISQAFPGRVNNEAARAMNLAADMGFEKVTVEVVEAL
jgi:type II secretory pathway predicted ATPase ExeA/DNA-binding XRE family transcriptional regulator